MYHLCITALRVEQQVAHGCAGIKEDTSIPDMRFERASTLQLTLSDSYESPGSQIAAIPSHYESMGYSAGAAS